MTSHPPADELSDEEHEQLLRREREKLDALLRRQSANGHQYRLASLLLGVTLLAGIFAWMRTWSSEERWRLGYGLTVIAVVFGLPIASVNIIRSRFMRERSYLWTVLVAQLVLPIVFGFGVNFVNNTPTWHNVAAVLICFFVVTASSVLIAWIPVGGLLNRGDEHLKAMQLGALWPLIAPLMFVLYRALLGDDRFRDVSSAAAGIYGVVTAAFPLTALVICVFAMISRWAIDFRQFDGPLLK
jgi:hypothetical protein